MFILGLTGGIASGKSTVSNYLASKNIPIVDADIGAREVVEVGTEGLQSIVTHFDKEVLSEDGSLNRKKLGAIIFDNETKRELLNQLLGTNIREWILTKVADYRRQDIPLLVLDIPLLYEASYQEVCDAVMVVYTPPEIQLERLIKRNGLTTKEAQDRINSQLSIEKKKQLADILIDNSNKIEDTYLQIDEWLDKMKF
ncbi:dephospho-CoA kinase [Jeotgalibaca ciconiae]|uniref:Dephospho-CoA kinase n=1 Tax=Jeotgalibaca ciconiae TaxID=2496265 RepID=A0A3S9HCG4_9LACT|nr:dephospho-CoA kinase [Jeotgalibaca ciconiae]AZP05027.1 dephospho-CoA kinase [Jeotgalibaca ciconiae]